jgi:hypothetical protein
MINNINDFEKKINSQNGEDGIIECIFNQVGVTNKFFVEFGIHSGIANTVFLRNKGWGGLWMDLKGGENIKKEKITAENINDLLDKYNVPNEFDLLSIDIDGNDYYVWKEIIRTPRVVVIEYNAHIPTDQSKAIKYNPNHKWRHDDYFGASLLAMKNLGLKKGYTLIGCDGNGVNAFFVKEDLVDGNFKIKSIDEVYKPLTFGGKVKVERVIYRKSKMVMEDV